MEENEQELKGAEGQGWEEDELLDVDLEEAADKKETNAKHEGEDVHGNAAKEPAKKAQTLNELLSPPRISLTKELEVVEEEEVVPEHGWEDEDVLDLDDLDSKIELKEPVSVVKKAEPVQKVQDSS